MKRPGDAMGRAARDAAIVEAPLNSIARPFDRGAGTESAGNVVAARRRICGIDGDSSIRGNISRPGELAPRYQEQRSQPQTTRSDHVATLSQHKPQPHSPTSKVLND